MQGSSSLPAYTNYMDSSFISELPIYNIKHQCSPNSSFSILIHQPPLSFPKGSHQNSNRNLDVLKKTEYLLCLVCLPFEYRDKLCQRTKFVAE